MARPATWFIPFALLFVALTAPLALRDPVVSLPAILAATAFAAYLLWRDYKSTGHPPHPLLTALFVLLTLVTSAIAAAALTPLF